MDARKALITDIFNNSTLVEIPFFQRSYVWGQDLWDRLLEDMEFIFKTHKSHFFGPIILKQGAQPSVGAQYTTRKTIVDGQQRLTTFLIFLKVLCLKKQQTLFFDHQFRIMGQEIALKHGKNDIQAFETVMSQTEAKTIENFAKSSRIIDAFNYFVANTDADNLDIMQIITNTQFVRIDLDANENEQQIFDTINSLGVNLTTSELLKNYFFDSTSIHEYETIWGQAFEKDEETKAYWDTELETGRIKRAMIDIFFDAYFQLFTQNQQYNISNEDKLMYARVDNLAQSYQHFINHYCNGNKNVILATMKEYALSFMQTFHPDQCDMAIPKNAGTERLNIIIFGLKNTTLIPYILFVVKNVKQQDQLNQICGILESYIMRRMIVHAPSKNYNNLFTSLILNNILDADSLRTRLQKSSDATTYIPNDANIEDSFKTIKLSNLQAKGIIYLLESSIRPLNSATTLLGFNSYSLEHLMPKKWRNHWPICSSAAQEQQRDLQLLTLGNLAIIPQSLNATIRDATWNIKKFGKGNKPGLIKCAGGLSTLQDALSQSSWDENAITERAIWLSNQAKTIWSI